jgi:hypothetical protein
VYQQNIELPVIGFMLPDGCTASLNITCMGALRVRGVDEIEPLAVRDFLVFFDGHIA